MIPITKAEAMALSKCGVKWGSELHRTNSNSHTYYLTEKDSAIKKLGELRSKCSKN